MANLLTGLLILLGIILYTAGGIGTIWLGTQFIGKPRADQAFICMIVWPCTLITFIVFGAFYCFGLILKKLNLID